MRAKNDLVIGACSGKPRQVFSAIRQGANANARYQGRTVLLWAVQEGHLKVVKGLVRAGASIDARDAWGFSALDQAVGDGRFEIVKFLLKAGAKVNGRTRNGSPLHTACAWRRVRIARLLLQRGADPNAIDEDGRTPIDFVKRARNGSEKTLKRILKTAMPPQKRRDK